MTNRKFYLTTFKVTVISEEIIDDTSLTNIAYQITDGDYSGVSEQEEVGFLNGQQAAAELIRQGSEPSFFNLTEEGEDLD